MNLTSLQPPLGFKSELCLLPFDHRSSFERDLLGIQGREPTTRESTEISTYKQIIYDGFKLAVPLKVPKEIAGILVDEQFGREILDDARSRHFMRACCVEKSGKEEFDFEYGVDFQSHILTIKPEFVKALVRYNPDSDAALNRRQAIRLRTLSDFCHKHGFRFMFELLVPATPGQLDQLGGSRSRYDLELRPKLMLNTLSELQAQGVEPDIWKVEGLPSTEEYAKLAEQACRGDRKAVALIVLGRSESKHTVISWLKAAAPLPQYKGFAIGRTIWLDPLTKVRRRELSPLDASKAIAEQFAFFYDAWRSARPHHSMRAA